jgi:hypothetical protein
MHAPAARRQPSGKAVLAYCQAPGRLGNADPERTPELQTTDPRLNLKPAMP